MKTDIIDIVYHDVKMKEEIPEPEESTVTPEISVKIELSETVFETDNKEYMKVNNYKTEDVRSPDEVTSTSSEHTQSTEHPFCQFFVQEYDYGPKQERKKIRIRRTLFECTFCDFKTKRKPELITHNRSHAGQIEFKCTQCEFKTRYRNALAVHERSHSEKKFYECTKCAYKARRKEDFIVHVRNHLGEKPFECSYCEYKTARKGNLAAHIRKHSEDKPFGCSECDYKTARKEDLIAHKRNHSGEKPFKCSNCDFVTAHSVNLIRHKRTHSGEKPYICPDCGFRTAHKGNLNSHRSIHVIVKPYECTECEFKTAHKISLTRHKEIHLKRIAYNRKPVHRKREQSDDFLELDTKSMQRNNLVFVKTELSDTELETDKREDIKVNNYKEEEPEPGMSGSHFLANRQFLKDRNVSETESIADK